MLMLFIQVLKTVWEFVSKVSDLAFKPFITLLITSSFVALIVQNNKINAIAQKIELKDSTETVRETKLESRITANINSMYYDGIAIFQSYAENQTEDLKTIIDKTSISADNSFLLKKLVEKSNSEIIQEIHKMQFKQKYLPDSARIGYKSLSYGDAIFKPGMYLNIDTTLKPYVYARCN